MYSHFDNYVVLGKYSQRSKGNVDIIIFNQKYDNLRKDRYSEM